MATKIQTSSHYCLQDGLGSASNSNREIQAIDNKLKYKTELCKNYLKGVCEFGSSCAFAHGPHELRKSNKLCYQYSENGYCLYGKLCQFAHVDRTQPAGDEFQSKHSSENEKPQLPLFIDLESRNIYI